MSPCGRIVDVARECFASEFRFFRDDLGRTIQVRWYRVPWDRAALGVPTIFSSSTFDADDDEDDLGEIKSTTEWVSGAPPLITPIGPPGLCGSAEQWANGLLTTDPLPPRNPLTGDRNCCGKTVASFRPGEGIGVASQVAPLLGPGEAVGATAALSFAFSAEPGEGIGAVAKLHVTLPTRAGEAVGAYAEGASLWRTTVTIGLTPSMSFIPWAGIIATIPVGLTPAGSLTAFAAWTSSTPIGLTPAGSLAAFATWTSSTPVGLTPAGSLAAFATWTSSTPVGLTPATTLTPLAIIASSVPIGLTPASVFTPAAPPPTPGSSCATAGAVTLPMTYTGTLAGGSRDWFTFPIVAGTRYHCRVTLNSGFSVTGFLDSGTCASSSNFVTVSTTTTNCVDAIAPAGAHGYIQVLSSFGSINYTIQVGTGTC